MEGGRGNWCVCVLVALPTHAYMYIEEKEEETTQANGKREERVSRAWRCVHAFTSDSVIITLVLPALRVRVTLKSGRLEGKELVSLV